jgi:hypothetical protein
MFNLFACALQNRCFQKCEEAKRFIQRCKDHGRGHDHGKGRGGIVIQEGNVNEFYGEVVYYGCVVNMDCSVFSKSWVSKRRATEYVALYSSSLDSLSS